MGIFKFSTVSIFSNSNFTFFILFQDSKQDDVINELQKKQTSLVMNLKSVVRTKSSPGDLPAQSDTGDNSKKRKQNSFLVEVQERAEVGTRQKQ